MRRGWWIGAALAGAWMPAGVLAQPVPAELAPATLALAAEIAAMAEKPRPDPRAFLAEARALQARAEADGRVPAEAMGMLFMLLTVGTFETLDYAGSLPFLDRAAEYYAQAGNARDRLAEVYNNQASIFRRLRRFDEAEASALKALEIRRALYGNAHRDVSSSLHALGNVYYSQGRIEEAAAALREAVAAQEAAEPVPGDYQILVLRLDGLAAFLNESGRDVEAVEVARRSADLARAHLAETNTIFPTALNTLGQNLLDVGMYEEAIPVIREALRVRAETLGPDHAWTASTQMILATALEETGRLDEAAELNDRAVGVMMKNRQLIDTATLAGLHLAIARLAARRQDWAAYDQRMAAGLADVDANLTDDNPARAFLHVFHASVLQERGRDGEALPIAERWVPVLQAKYIPAHSDRIFGELLLARLRAAAGRPPAEIWPVAEAAVEALSARLSDVGASHRQLASEADKHSAAALLYFTTALATGDRERVFEALQLLTISELSLSQGRTGDGAAAAPGSAEAAHAALLRIVRREGELDRRHALAIEAQQGDKAEALRAQLAEARAERQRAEQVLRERFPEFVARYRPAPVSLADLQASLADGELLVMPVEAAGGGWTVTLGRTRGLAWRPFDNAALAAHARALRRAVDEPSDLTRFPLADAAALYRMLLPDGVPEGGTLLVHGGKLLSSLPLSLLLTREWSGPLAEAPWLIRGASVQVLGNLAVHVRQRGRAAPPRIGETRMVGIGGADLPGGSQGAGEVQLAALFRSGRPALASISGLLPLPNAASELRAIAAALPGEDDLILVGPDAAEESLKRADLSGARVLAFATHGLVSGEIRDLWEPALLVGTAEGSGEDGLLGASEIARLTLDADWVILSACNTASGDDLAGATYSGLAAAFAQAGARSLMLSHWRVRDDAAARLSVGTVRGAAAGLSRAEALRRAQLALLADASVPGAAHPAIWAPFVIIEN